MILRDYQVKAADAIDDALSRHRSTLCVMATGTGKTVVFGHVVKRWMKKGRVMILAHREELLSQAQSKISTITGYWPSMEKADQYANTETTFDGTVNGRIIVSSIQTQVSGSGDWRRMRRFKPAEFSLVIIDEAHRSRAASYEAVVEYYLANPDCKLLGVTATPKRTDKKAMGQIFESVAFEYGAADAVSDGWLVRPQQAYTTIHDLDLSRVRVSGDDLNQGDLAALMEFAGPLNKVAKATIDDCGERKTIVFTVSVNQARMLTEIINQHKPQSARLLTGKTDETQRLEIMRGFRRGDFQYLVNVAIATEGLDVPDCSAIVMARPTKSLLVYSQQLGRGMRPLNGCVDGLDDPLARVAAIAASKKPNCIVIDFVGNSGRHKLVRVTDILGGKYSAKVRELAERKMQESTKPQDVARVLEESQKEITGKEREAAVKLAEDRARAKKTVRWIDPFDTFDMAAAREYGWNTAQPATPAQIHLLEKFKINAEGMSKSEASSVIGTIMDRKKRGLCSGPQMQLLKHHGYDATNMTAAEAGKIITALRENKWRPLKNPV